MTENSVANCGMNRSVKIVMVGDGTVGKTSLLITYTCGEFPSGGYIPPVFKDWGTLDCDGTTFNLKLWDTAGQEDYDRLRPLSYPGADLFLLCFSVDNIRSFQNITSKWHPEVKHHCPKVPYILVGTKSDLRPANGMNHHNPDNAQNMAKKFVTKAMARKLVKTLKAVNYVECSAKNMIGVEEVFKESVRPLLNPQSNLQSNTQSKKSCVLV